MNKKKVLIIDDEKDFCILMQFYLTKKNCEVSVSHTLREGLSIIQSLHPDIVILDNNLPDGYGWNAAQNILATSPDAHLFLISAYKPTQKKHDEHLNLHVIEKPLSIEQIDSLLK